MLLATQPADTPRTLADDILRQAEHQGWHAWRHLSSELGELLTRPHESPDFAGQLRALARRVLHEVRRAPDVAIFEVVHDSADKLLQYGVVHSLHTAILIALVGLRKDWSQDWTQTGILAALTANIAITDLQTALAQQEEPLSYEQRQAIHEHPIDGARQLSALGVSDPDWLTAVEQHHEQTDGKGYPMGLHQVHVLADAIRTCDVFSAKMSPRASRTVMMSPRAMAEIFRQRSAGYFGATLVRELGLYPPGSLVRLATGEIAMVLCRTRHPQAPDVALLTHPDGSPREQPERRATSPSGEHRVVSAVVCQDLSGLHPPARLLVDAQDV